MSWKPRTLGQLKIARTQRNDDTKHQVVHVNPEEALTLYEAGARISMDGIRSRTTKQKYQEYILEGQRYLWVGKSPDEETPLTGGTNPRPRIAVGESKEAVDRG